MLTQQQIAEHLDLERSTVSRLVDRLNIDYRTASMDEVRIAYLRHLREMAAGRASETGIDLVAERAMTERVDREIKLLTLAEKKGQLVNAAQRSLSRHMARWSVPFRRNCSRSPTSWFRNCARCMTLKLTSNG